MSIAFDAKSDGNSGGGTNTFSLSHTCTGANLILWAGIATTTVGNTITSVTYGGANMTYAGVTLFLSPVNFYLYYITGPATGANNITVNTLSNDAEIDIRGVSYTGASQTGVPDAKITTGPDTSTTTLTTTITTMANNCWVIAFLKNNQGAWTAGSGMTIRSTSTLSNPMVDSNSAVTPAGSYSMTGTWSGSGTGLALTASFAPVAPAPPGFNIAFV